MAKYIVRLTTEERMQLTEPISTGRCAATGLAQAQMLLKADASERGPGWSDREIAETLERLLSSVQRVRQAFVEAGLVVALEGKHPTGG
jgi:hypothetical protein